MAHKRKTIRDAVVALLTGLASTGSHVFSGRVYELQEADLPCLEIMTLQESVEYVSQSQQREQQRTLQLDIVAKAKALAGVDDVLDTIATEVEAAMDTSQLLGGLIANYTLTDTQIHVDASGNQAMGSATLSYELTYYTIEGI